MAHACGALEELNAWCGLIGERTENAVARIFLTHLQGDLGEVVRYLRGDPSLINGYCAADTTHLERMTDELETSRVTFGKNQASTSLPGGCNGAAETHVARAVCCRAERHLDAISDSADYLTGSRARAVLCYAHQLSATLLALASFLCSRRAIK